LTPDCGEFGNIRLLGFKDLVDYVLLRLQAVRFIHRALKVEGYFFNHGDSIALQANEFLGMIREQPYLPNA
jgi:hypothetical protein